MRSTWRVGEQTRELVYASVNRRATSQHIWDFQREFPRSCLQFTSESHDHQMMIATTRKQKKYDHRLKDVVRASGRTDLARQHGVPESTARGWVSSPRPEVVTPDVDEYNAKLPHSAFRGQTPDEMYFGTGENVADDLEAKRVAARQSRLQSNQGASCTAREPLTEISS